MNSTITTNEPVYIIHAQLLMGSTRDQKETQNYMYTNLTFHQEPSSACSRAATGDACTYLILCIFNTAGHNNINIHNIMHTVKPVCIITVTLLVGPAG